MTILIFSLFHIHDSTNLDPQSGCQNHKNTNNSQYMIANMTAIVFFHLQMNCNQYDGEWKWVSTPPTSYYHQLPTIWCYPLYDYRSLYCFSNVLTFDNLDSRSVLFILVEILKCLKIESN